LGGVENKASRSSSGLAETRRWDSITEQKADGAEASTGRNFLAIPGTAAKPSFAKRAAALSTDGD